MRTSCYKRKYEDGHLIYIYNYRFKKLKNEPNDCHLNECFCDVNNNNNNIKEWALSITSLWKIATGQKLKPSRLKTLKHLFKTFWKL